MVNFYSLSFFSSFLQWSQHILVEQIHHGWLKASHSTHLQHNIRSLMTSFIFSSAVLHSSDSLECRESIWCMLSMPLQVLMPVLACPSFRVSRTTYIHDGHATVQLPLEQGFPMPASVLCLFVTYCL